MVNGSILKRVGSFWNKSCPIVAGDISLANKKLAWIAIIGAGMMSAGSVEARQNEVNRLPDDEITKAVASALRYDYKVPSDSVHVVIQNGEVTLSGTVADLLERDRAERIANTVVGVRAVHNTIKVTPLVRKDDEIKADVISALKIDPAVGSQKFQVKVRSGAVALSGTVASFVEKECARQLTMRVPGVSEVKDDLAIATTNNRSDSDIDADIRALIRTNVVFRETALSPQVHEGNVIISGVVISVAQRDELLKDLGLPGVKSVDVSGIQVDPWAATAGTPQKFVEKATTPSSTIPRSTTDTQ